MRTIAPLDIEAFLAAIVADLRAGFPQLQTVEEYSDAYLQAATPLRAPAVLIDLFALEPQPDLDPGTGQRAVTPRLEATVVLGFSEPSVERAVRSLAASIGARIAGSRFGQHIGPAVLVDVEPQTFAPELDQYVAWRVEWFHKPAYLGEAVWPGTGASVVEVRLAADPETGPAHELDYEYIEPRP